MGFFADVKKLDEKGPHLLERFFSEKPRVYLDRYNLLSLRWQRREMRYSLGREANFFLTPLIVPFMSLSQDLRKKGSASHGRKKGGIEKLPKK